MLTLYLLIFILAVLILLWYYHECEIKIEPMSLAVLVIVPLLWPIFPVLLLIWMYVVKQIDQDERD
jgi:hypothetical protein